MFKKYCLFLIAILAISSIGIVSAREITINHIPLHSRDEGLFWFNNFYGDNITVVPNVVDIHTDTKIDRYFHYTFGSTIPAYTSNIHSSYCSQYKCTYLVTNTLKFEGNESIQFYVDHIDGITLPFYGTVFKYWFYNRNHDPQYMIYDNNTVFCWNIDDYPK